MNEFNNIPDSNEPPKNDENHFVDQSTISSETKVITAKISPISAAFLGLVGGFFLYQIVGGLLTLIILGFDIENANVTSVRLMTTAGQILFILLPALLFTKLIYEDVSEIIRLKIPSLKEIALFVVGIIILTPLLQNYLYIQNYFITTWAENSEVINTLKSFFDKLNELVEKTYGNLLRADNVFEGIFVVIVIAFVPAICEEVMFRGYIQRSFELKIRPVMAAFVTAVFFGLYHFNPYGILPLIALGFYFGFAAYMSQSIFIPMILHFLNNFTAVLLYFVLGSDELIKSAPGKDINLGQALILFLLLTILFIAFIFLIKKFYRQEERRSYAGLS
jgi:membrane protease YdiL (CAAX protease family)